ncbi:MAG TPA: hypothetical protein VGT41_04215 [Candidatus Babeliales bacterium]|nr:hypothetical protein [Candidatus Babeliales bacterium]
MQLIIITPEEKKMYDISWLECNSPAGNFVILPDHAPTVLTLTPEEPITFCLTTGKIESVTPQQGIINITRTSITALLKSV